MKKLLENINLSQYTTYKIGGPAKYFIVAKDIEDVKYAIQFAFDNNLPFYILGLGSNVLVNDSGFNGVMIKMDINFIKVNDTNVICGAGVLANNLLEALIKEELVGMEYMAGIPTTVGGAVFGNAGAYGHDISEVIEKVKIIEINNKNIKERIFSKEQCEFSYRNSFFKKNNQRNIIITEAVLKLKKGDIKTSLSEINEIIEKRKNAYPHVPSSGCSFKNIVYSDTFSKLEKYQIYGKIPAGKLIDEAGLKGYTVGGAKISDNHANFIINTGKAKAKDVIEVIKHVKNEIKLKFGVELIEEIEYIGFN